jgi:hypothetical protein
MFLTRVIKILNPLSFNVKFHHYNFFSIYQLQLLGYGPNCRLKK